jgi:hypothetical protein
MRKLLVGLVVAGFMAMAGPASAQFFDPLGLATSGVVLPYFADAGGVTDPVNLNGDISILEVYAPNGPSSGFHMFFFDGRCNRGGPSVGMPLTANDVELLVVNSVKGSGGQANNRPTFGLITAAAQDQTGFELRPLGLTDAVMSKVLWFNVAGDFGRQLDPIAIGSPDSDGVFFWNGLRSGAAFWAPPDIAGVQRTTVYFICPDSNITGKTAAAFPETFFPPLIPAATDHTRETVLRIRAYDDNERFLRDVLNSCSCLTVRPVALIDGVYANHDVAPNGVYSEVEANDETRAVSFAGYRAIGIGPAVGTGGIEVFGRLSNGWRCDIDGGSDACIAEFEALGTFR